MHRKCLGFHSALIALGIALAFIGVPPARAAIISYDFTFVDGPLIGFYSGQFQVNDATSQIVGITGSGTNIGTITALLPPGTLGGNDNLFLSGYPYLDFNGVSFSTTGFGSLNLFYNGAGYTTGGASFGAPGAFSTTISAVPEPASLALFGAGLFGLATVARRRRRGPTATV